MKRPLAVVACALVASCATFAAPPYRGPKSDHFDGTRFVNPSKKVASGVLPIIGWALTRERGVWPKDVDQTVGPKPTERVTGNRIVVTNVGHATVLVQMDGLNILTDPVWSEAVGPPGFALQGRVRPPAIRFEDLPPIDLILISHNHYDHLDVPTLERLAEAHGARIAAGLGSAAMLKRLGIRNVRDFDWWDEHPVSRTVRITSVPVQHFSRRGLTDDDTILWTGFVIEGPSGRVYFAGDTGYGPHFAAAKARLGPMRLALLPIGAYKPREIMAPIHIDPAQAVQAHIDLEARTSVAMHYGTFEQADDGYHQPVEEVQVARRQLGVPDAAFRTLDFGVGTEIP